MKRHRQKPNEEYNFWQPATDMMSGLVFVLVLIIALLGLYLLSDYTGYEEASSVSSEGPSSSGTGWNNNDPGGWYYDGGTGDGDGDGNGQFDQQIIQTGGGGGYGEDGIKTAVFVEVVDDETERRIPEAGVTFELYRTDTTHLQNGSLQTLNTYYPEKINYRDYETTEEGVFYLPEKIWQGSYYFHELTEPEGYDAAGDTYYDVNRMYDWPDPYVVQIRLSPCKNIIRIQMNDAETQLPVGGGTFRVIAAEDIVTKDGTVPLYAQGQYADTIVCDENGYGESKELYLGNYTVQQQTAPNYYTTMQEDLNVEVEKKNGEDPELHEIDAEKTKIALSVTDELNSTGLEGVTFAVSNERTGITQTVTTDAAGNVLLTDLDKSTTYHIREQQTLENYRLDNTDYTMTVAADGRIDGLSTAALSITNRMLRVSIHAVDMVLRSDTADEQLSLYNAQDQLIQTWTTNGSGEMFTDLTEGSYYVVRGEPNAENAKKYNFTVQDTARQQNWNVPVFTLRSAIALAVLAVIAAGVIWLLVFLWGVLARRKARKAAEAQKEEKNEEDSNKKES